MKEIIKAPRRNHYDYYLCFIQDYIDIDRFFKTFGGDVTLATEKDVVNIGLRFFIEMPTPVNFLHSPFSKDAVVYKKLSALLRDYYFSYVDGYLYNKEIQERLSSEVEENDDYEPSEMEEMQSDDESDEVIAMDPISIFLERRRNELAMEYVVMRRNRTSGAFSFVELDNIVETLANGVEEDVFLYMENKELEKAVENDKENIEATHVFYELARKCVGNFEKGILSFSDNTHWDIQVVDDNLLFGISAEDDILFKSKLLGRIYNYEMNSVVLHIKTNSETQKGLPFWELYGIIFFMGEDGRMNVSPVSAEHLKESFSKNFETGETLPFDESKIFCDTDGNKIMP